MRVSGRRVLPPLAEGRLDVVHRRPLHRDLHVVPRRSATEDLRHDDPLVVAPVVGVVTTAVAQVDPADVGDVAARVVAVPQDDELLVVRPTRAHPHVTQALPAGLVDLDAEQARLLGVEPEPVPVRAPEQAADVGPAAGGRREGRGDRVAVVGHQLVGVAPPVDEVEEVALAEGADPVVELGHVRRPVDDGPDVVPHAPRGAVRVVVVDVGVGVLPLLGEQEEVGEHHRILPNARRPGGDRVEPALSNRTADRRPRRGPRCTTARPSMQP